GRGGGGPATPAPPRGGRPAGAAGGAVGRRGPRPAARRPARPADLGAGPRRGGGKADVAVPPLPGPRRPRRRVGPPCALRSPPTGRRDLAGAASSLDARRVPAGPPRAPTPAGGCPRRGRPNAPPPPRPRPDL